MVFFGKKSQDFLYRECHRWWSYGGIDFNKLGQAKSLLGQRSRQSAGAKSPAAIVKG